MYGQRINGEIDLCTLLGFPGGTSGKEPTCQCTRFGRYRFDPWVGGNPLEEGMATHSSILAWRISWTEEPGGLQPIRLHSRTQLKQQHAHWVPLGMGFSDVMKVPSHLIFFFLIGV